MVQSRADRVKGAVLAVIVQAAIGYALITGLALHLPRVVGETLTTFAVAPPPPPPPVETLRPDPVRSQKREGAASPPNLRSKATPVVAPPPIILPPVPPPPIAVALKAGIGSDPTAGNADVRGPGTGSGGVGNGTGSGRYGDGAGDGGAETPPRWRRGRLKYSDAAGIAGDEGIAGTVGVEYVVAADGRVSECSIDRSSGHPDLDALTCRLIKQRFRFAPSLDARGRPVPSVVVESHEWVVEQVPAAEDGG